MANHKKPENYIKCELCKKEFYRCPSWQKMEKQYCSMKCAGLANRTTVSKKCEGCNKDLKMPSWLSKRVRFCSKGCFGAFRRKQTEIKYQVKCLICSKEFKKEHSSQGKYCSKTCRVEARKIYGNKPSCIDCGKKLTAHHCVRCIECNGKFRTGEKHHLWIPDRSKLAKKQERGDSAYREWRRQVWVRDNYKCKMGNQDCKGRIEAHHILSFKDYPELRYEVNNGITLCHHHHPRKREDEKRLSPFFTELLATNTLL